MKDSFIVSFANADAACRFIDMVNAAPDGSGITLHLVQQPVMVMKAAGSLLQACKIALDKIRRCQDYGQAQYVLEAAIKEAQE